MSILLRIRSPKYVQTHQICFMSLIGFFTPQYRYILIFGDKLYPFDFTVVGKFRLQSIYRRVFIDMYYKY